LITPIVLEIAGIRVALTGAPDALAAAARQRYRRFLVAEGPAALTIALGDCGPAGHDPESDPEVRCVGDRAYTLRYGALEASLDLRAGSGRAALPDSVHVVDSLLRITMSLLLLERDGLLLHASAVAVDGGALVCFGPSGVGKTTTARRVAPTAVLCDEVVALIADGAGGNRLRAAGTPFHGDLDVCAPTTLPVLALVRLRQGDHDELRPLAPSPAVRELLGSTLFFCREETQVARVLDLAARIAHERAHVLTFTRECNVPRFVATHLGQHPLPARA
jgi:hypothetical protein